MEQNNKTIRYANIPKDAYDLGLQLVSYLDSCKIGHFGLDGQPISRLSYYRSRQLRAKKGFFDRNDGDHDLEIHDETHNHVDPMDSITRMVFPTIRIYSEPIMIDGLNLVDFIQNNVYQIDISRVNIRNLPKWDNRLPKEVSKKIKPFFPKEIETVVQLSFRLNIDENDDIEAFDRAILKHFRLKEQHIVFDSSMFIAGYDRSNAELVSLLGFKGTFVMQDLSERGLLMESTVENDASSDYKRRIGKHAFVNRSEYSIFMYTECENLCLYEL